MLDDIIYIGGQIFGIAPIVFGFISFQAKSSRGIIFWQLATALSFSLHYLMIGAITGMALNLVAALKGITYYFRNKKGSKELFTPIFFTVLAIFTSILTWQAWYSLFLLTGLIINTLSFALLSPQKVRVCMLAKAPITIVYNVFVFSIAGIVYESIIFISAIIGLIRLSKKHANSQRTYDMSSSND